MASVNVINRRVQNFATALGLSLCVFGPLTTNIALSQGNNQPEMAAVNLYNEGVRLATNQKPAEAVDKFRQALAISPNFADAHANLGACLAQTGNFVEGTTELEKATVMKPGLPQAWATLGTCYQAQGRTEEAIKCFKQYLKLQPNAPEAAKIKSAVALLENEVKRTAGLGAASASDHDYFADATQNGIGRWPKTRMPLTIFIKVDPAVPNYEPKYEQLLRQTFAEWQEVLQGRVEFKFVDDAQSAEIVCHWTDDPRQMLSSAEGGHAVVIPDSQGILKSDIILLTVPPTSTFKMTDNYAKHVDLHEIGHALGIFGHSRIPGDIMFSTILPNEQTPKLTDRDKNTMFAIYDASEETVKSHPLDMNRMAMSGDPASGVNQILRLNAEAADAMKANNFKVAIEKLEAAHKIDPSSDLVNRNLGTAYANWAMLSTMMRNFPQADMYFKKAVPIISQHPDNPNLLPTLKAYAFVLQATKQTAELAKINARIQALSK